MICLQCPFDSRKLAEAFRYDEPAKAWTSALPVGNGRLGAIVFGDPAVEHLQLNEVTLFKLPDAERRKKLMLIYSEDLAPTGSNFQELSAPSGKDRWMTIKSELIERALTRIQLATSANALPTQQLVKSAARQVY